MEILAPQVLQERADAVVDGFASVAGKNPTTKTLILLTTRSMEEDFQDLNGVLLGIKPSAGLMDPILSTLEAAHEDLPNRLFESVRKTDVSLRHSRELGFVWNPRLVGEVLTQNGQTVSRLLNDRPELNATIFPIDSPGFVDFYKAIAFERWASCSGVVEGLLYGYPSEATTLYMQYYEQMHEAIQRVAEHAQMNGEPSAMPSRYNLTDFCTNKAGMRTNFLRLAQDLTWNDPRVLLVMAKMRKANVPGFKYATFGRLTTAHEETYTALFNDSRIEQKMDNFFRG